MYALLWDKKYYFYIKIQLQKAKGRKNEGKGNYGPNCPLFSWFSRDYLRIFKQSPPKLSKAEQKEDHDHHREKDILIL